MTEPDRSPPGDELTQRYREASAQDTRRPGAHVREAVRAHAQMVIEASRQTTAPGDVAEPTAANQSRWKISALAGLALAGLTGLLVLQYDRGTDEEKDLAFGQPSASAPPAPATAPAAPAVAQPQTPQADNRSAKAGPAESPAPILKTPAKPAAAKPAPQPSATGSTAPKAQAEAAPSPAASATPSRPAPPPSAPEVAADRESSQFARPAGQAEATTGGLAARPAPAPQLEARATAAPAAAAQSPAPVAAPAPAAPAPAAAAPATAAPEQRREKLGAPGASLRAETPGIPRLAGALQNAARAGDLPQVERLLQQGAALNAADAAGRTPLVLAAMQGHTAVVQRLLAAGANTALVDNDGLNALQHARRLGYDGIAHLIETAR